MKILKHLKLVLTHKKYVFKYSVMCGIPIQGILHDLSKFSPIEFFESAKYYSGTESPINVCKRENGYSKAWFHHKGRNKHHYEYWVDNLDHGGKPIKMPYKYAVEMLCDYLGAGNAYFGEDFTYEKELEWWNNKISNPVMIHPHTKKFIDSALNELAEFGEWAISKPNLVWLYMQEETEK